MTNTSCGLSKWFLAQVMSPEVGASLIRITVIRHQSRASEPPPPPLPPHFLVFTLPPHNHPSFPSNAHSCSSHVSSRGGGSDEGLCCFLILLCWNSHTFACFLTKGVPLELLAFSIEFDCLVECVDHFASVLNSLYGSANCALMHGKCLGRTKKTRILSCSPTRTPTDVQPMTPALENISLRESLRQHRRKIQAPCGNMTGPRHHEPF